MRPHARQTAVRADRLENGPARSFVLPGRRLPEGSRVLRRAHELDGPQRRRQAGRARHRRLGRPRAFAAAPAATRSAGAPAPPAGDRRRAAAAARGGGPRAPRNAAFDGFCWGIEPWDAKKVEAELKKRGLTPVADNDGKDFQSFHVKDPDGFDLQISNGNRKNRRQGPANGKTSAPAPFEPTTWKTVWLDHISFEVSNYKETVAFYMALLGWKPGRTKAARTSARSATSATSSSAAAAAATAARRRRDAAGAPRGDRPHLVRHYPVRSG